MTKDGVPVILHGGDNGELNHHFKLNETTYIFDKTYEELQVHDMGEGQRIPTLDQLLAYVDKRMFMNIEVKTPFNREVKLAYNYKQCVNLVHNLIAKYQIEEKCWVSSFDHDVLAELEHLNSVSNTNVDTIYLYNFYDNCELPDPEIYATRGKGINISSTKLNEEVVRNCHLNGKTVGVWIDRSVSSEGEEFYKRLLDLKVDFFCTDYPHDAMNYR